VQHGRRPADDTGGDRCGEDEEVLDPLAGTGRDEER
jgi:hypothetical protein